MVDAMLENFEYAAVGIGEDGQLGLDGRETMPIVAKGLGNAAHRNGGQLWEKMMGFHWRQAKDGWFPHIQCRLLTGLQLLPASAVRCVMDKNL